MRVALGAVLMLFHFVALGCWLWLLRKVVLEWNMPADNTIRLLALWACVSAIWSITSLLVRAFREDDK